ncbi:hypothetical protein [Acetobacterium malicum]|uniref:hypothetical protein n=1 Tax=Acetobacterium malicum TaxID=52692 RepID=UPI0004192409|nr:hypothetical protein [Acetobacterium dehalogenans]
MKNHKKYQFNTQEDFIKGFYLIAEHATRYFYRYRDLLTDSQKNLIGDAKKILFDLLIESNCCIEGDFKTLLVELKKDGYKDIVLSASHKLNLNYKNFKDYEERLSYNHGILLNTFGDSSGVSYFRLRSEYKKKFKELKLPHLTENHLIDKSLYDCLKSRNYAHHFSESKLLTWRNFREEQLRDHPDVIWPPNDIEITRCNITNIITLLETFYFYNTYYPLFSALQFFVRNDYCLLATGNGCHGTIIINELNKVDDYSALIISKQSGNLYSE